MFKNLDAEQARAGMSNTNVAEKLGMPSIFGMVMSCMEILQAGHMVRRN